jgi:WD40 repeat protein
MPNLTKESFPVQTKSNFKVVSEFFNFSDSPYQIVLKNFIFSVEYHIYATVRLNKIFIFVEKLKAFALCNVIRNESTFISLLKFSDSGSKLSFVIRKKVVLVFKLSQKISKVLKINGQFFFKKVLEFSCESEKPIDLISTCFTKNENFIILSFSNGKILIINCEGKIFSIFKFKSPIFNLISGIGANSKFEFYGILKENCLVSYNLFTKKTKNFKNSEIFLIRKNFIISFSKRTIKISCNCHGKVIKSIFLSQKISKILPMENNEILIWGNGSFFFINFQFLNVFTIKLYCFEKYLLQGKFFNSRQGKIFFNHGSFSILFFLRSTNFLEIKPLTEKFIYFVNSNTIIIRNESINSVKFFGKKNSILIGNKSPFINVLNGSCFKFVGLFPIENVIPTEIILKEKFILIGSSSHEIYIYNLVSSSLLEKNYFSEKFSMEFFVNKGKHPKIYLICGFGNGFIKCWKLFFYNFKKTELKLVWIKKITNDPILLLSASIDFGLLVLLTKKKGTFLMETRNKDLTWRVVMPKKKICCVKFSPRNKLLCGGTENGSVVFYDININNIFKILKGDGSMILNLEFNKKGSILIAGSYDGIIRIISVSNLTSFKVLKNHDKPVWGVGFSEDETIVSGCTEGKMIFLKDISFELSKKQTRKFSRIFLLKKALKINKFYENFEFVFKRIVFSKNPFVFMDFLEFSYRKNPLDFEKILSKFINFFESPAINFIFKSLVLWNQIKKGNNFTYKIIFEILANLKIKKLIEIDPSVLKKIVGLVEEWILKLKNLIELSKNNIL